MRAQAFISLGWTPILAVATVSGKRVLQVIGWEGGTGTIPSIGMYIGSSGYTTDINLATDISGDYYFSENEVPSGVINGLNTTFTLINTPIINSEKLYLNGQRLKNGDDYTISGNTLTMINIPHLGDKLLIDYRY